MVRHPAVEPEVTKPAISEVEVDFIAQPPFGSDGKPACKALDAAQVPRRQIGPGRPIAIRPAIALDFTADG